MPVAHRVQLIQHDRRASELPQHRHDLRLQRVVEARVDAGHVAAGEGIPGDGGDLGVFLSWGGLSLQSQEPVVHDLPHVRLPKVARVNAVAPKVAFCPVPLAGLGGRLDRDS